MKLSSFFALGVLTANSVSAAKQVRQSEKPLLTTNTPVPGQSPLVYCGATEQDILKIEYVNLTPNPPEPGKELVIEAAGTVKDKIEKGAYIKIEVKYGYIKLLSEQLDLCDNVHEVNMECPIEPGKLHLTKTVDLPQPIPPGKYHVRAEVYTVDDQPITCLTADVHFNAKVKFLVDL